MSIYDALQPVFTAVGAVVCLIFSLWAIAFISVGIAHLVGSVIIERRHPKPKLVGRVTSSAGQPVGSRPTSAERSRTHRAPAASPFRGRSASSVGRARW